MHLNRVWQDRRANIRPVSSLRRSIPASADSTAGTQRAFFGYSLPFGFL